MKTTVVIDDHIMRRLKQEAARRGVTMSELVESALRRLLEQTAVKTRRLPPLPTFSSQCAVDISDRKALYDLMEGRGVPDGYKRPRVRG